VLVLLVALATTAHAEGGRVVSGKVVADGDVPLPTATVVLVLADGTQRTVTAGDDGSFRFGDVPDGAVTLLGVFGKAQTRIVVEGDTPVRLEIDLGPEVISIREQAPPAVAPEPIPGSVPRTWPYSDEATDRNAWGVVWLRVYIDESGKVTDAVVLKSPPELELDEIAVATAKKARYTPARDDQGRAVKSTMVMVLEWPPYWTGGVPVCKGSGPLNLDVESAYRDCEPPKGMEALRLKNPRGKLTINRGRQRTIAPFRRGPRNR
jgi:TonB family protein